MSSSATTSVKFAAAADICLDGVLRLAPPRRIAVSQAAIESVRVATPSGSSVWDADLTPYMLEPLDRLSSRKYEAVVFVGPARSGKTQALVDGWLAYMATCDPGDALLYFATEANALDYSRRRLRRLLDNSPQLSAIKSPRGHDNNMTSISLRHGMLITLGWPTSSQLAQKDARYVALSDYDSMPDDVGGEGSPFDLARKRVQAMLSSGMAMAESSPKRPIVVSDWRPSTPHEAPPTDGGILSLYNRGTRHRWYWCCLHCGKPWEAPALPDYDEVEDIAEAAASAHVACPHCGGVHQPHDKRALQQTGRWVADESTDGATIASYWVKGCAAAFQPWPSLVRNFLAAKRTYEQSGQEEALRTTTNVDQGLPYLPRSMRTSRTVDQLYQRTDQWGERTVPEGVKFLIAAVDVQANRFVVQVFGRGDDGERWLIDRYDITHSSTRVTRTGDHLPLDPAGYLEDWQTLIPIAQVGYPLAEDESRQMIPRLVGIDSGGASKPGKVSVTSRAYDFWRQMVKAKVPNFRLLKGHSGGEGKPLVWRTFPDSKRKDRAAGAHGDIPIHWVNTLLLKDALDVDFARDEPGPGYIHLPEWIGKDVLAELCAEVRGPKRWERTGPNEAWDLFVYESALALVAAWERGRWKAPAQVPWDDRKHKQTAPAPANVDVVSPGIKPRTRPAARRSFARSWRR